MPRTARYISVHTVPISRWGERVPTPGDATPLLHILRVFQIVREQYVTCYIVQYRSYLYFWTGTCMFSVVYETYHEAPRRLTMLYLICLSTLMYIVPLTIFSCMLGAVVFLLLNTYLQYDSKYEYRWVSFMFSAQFYWAIWCFFLFIFCRWFIGILLRGGRDEATGKIPILFSVCNYYLSNFPLLCNRKSIAVCNKFRTEKLT